MLYAAPSRLDWATGRLRRMLQILHRVPFLFAVASSVLLADTAAAQDQAPLDVPSNSVYVTAGELTAYTEENVVTLSASYERVLWDASIGNGLVTGVRLRGGFGYANSPEAEDVEDESYLVPLMLSGAVGTSTHQLEIGIGVVPLWHREGYGGPSGPFQFTTDVQTYVGYRLGLGPVLLRLSVSPLLDESAPLGLVFYPGLSLGVRF